MEELKLTEKKLNKQDKKSKHYEKMIPKFKAKINHLTKINNEKLATANLSLKTLTQNKDASEKALKKAKKHLKKAHKKVKKINSQNLSYPEMVDRYDFKILLIKIIIIICLVFCIFSIVEAAIKGNNPFSEWI